MQRSSRALSPPRPPVFFEIMSTMGGKDIVARLDAQRKVDQEKVDVLRAKRERQKLTKRRKRLAERIFVAMIGCEARGSFAELAHDARLAARSLYPDNPPCPP